MNFDRIYLTGFMGSGKSTVAPKLARGLGYKATDLDDEIVQRTGLSIPALFDLYGQERFREEEQQSLHETADHGQRVISLGGGALTFGSNLSWCKEHGIVVYLRGSAAFLASRLQQSRRQRPLLFDEAGNPLKREALLERVSSLLNQREPIYAQAHIVVEIDAKDVREVVEEIRAVLGEGGGG